MGRGIVLALLILAASMAEAARGTGGSTAGRDESVIPGVVVIKFRTALEPGFLLKKATPLGSALVSEGIRSLRRPFPGPALQKRSADTDLSRIYFAEVAAERDPVAIARRLSRLPEVEYAEPKYYQRLLDTPNDSLLALQIDAFTRLNVFDGWSLAKGSPSVPIATVDGGTYWLHEDLQPALWVNTPEDLNGNGTFDPGAPPLGDEDGIDQDGNGFVDDVIGWNFATGTNNPQGSSTQPGSSSHGTATASHFGAVTNNRKGMAGTSWGCALMPICAAAASGDNLIGFGYEGIEYAARMGARVINCSWGRLGSYSLFEQDVINAATALGALVVAAAGNYSTNNDYLPHYPSSYRNVLGVGATQSASDALAGFSDYGVGVTVYAPGTHIWSAFTTGGYGDGGSGTSYSSPLVAGLAGILTVIHPSWTPQRIAAQIRVTADSIDAVTDNLSFAGKLGRGRVNFARALSENHAALDVSATLSTPAGKGLFIKGDTVLVSVTARNILFTAANGVHFTLSSFDPELVILSGTADVPVIPAGGEVLLPPFVCRVADWTTARTVVLKLSWVSNGNEADAAAFRTTVYPSTPLWLTSGSPSTLPLFSVRAVSKDIAWASGGSGSATDAVVVRTTNGGSVWESVSSNLPAVDLYCIEAVDADHAWVGTGGGAIYATTNGGQSWSAQPYPGIQSGFIDGIRFFDLQNGYALGDPPSGSSKFVLLRTTDGGANWSHFTNEPVGVTGEVGWINSFAWSDPRHGWFGTNVSRVWRTSDGGASWQSAASGASSSYAVTFRDSLRGIVGHENGLVARSTDGGLSWSPVAFPSTETLTGASSVLGQPMTWAATSTQIYRTTDDGTTWVSQLASPFTGGINHISLADTSHGWAVTSNGEVIAYAPSGGGTAVEPEPLPAEYRLSQNYPNPFNPTTVITYQLAVAGEVRLAVYDLLGREVAVLLRGRQDPGSHTVTFNASGLASGVYFYRLTAGDFAAVRKMVYMK